VPIEDVSFVPASVVGCLGSMDAVPKKSVVRSRSKEIEMTLRNGRLLRVVADIDLEVLWVSAHFHAPSRVEFSAA